MNEKELEEKLERKLYLIEPGLILIERQKRVETGIIDLFCQDKNGKFVIIEIKIKPNTEVVAQLAKYYMSLVKSGIPKKKLRCILVARSSSKAVQAACTFFHFELKHVYKEKKPVIKKIEVDIMNLVDKEELIRFIKQKEYVNLSMIAKHFNIHPLTAGELAEAFRKAGVVNIQKLGGSKFVTLKTAKS